MYYVASRQEVAWRNVERSLGVVKRESVQDTFKITFFTDINRKF